VQYAMFLQGLGGKSENMHEHIHYVAYYMI